MFDLSYLQSKKDFVQLYYDDLNKYGNISSKCVSDINTMVLSEFYGILSQDEYDRTTLDISIAAKSHNEHILSTYAVDDPSKLPKYAFDQLMPEYGDLSAEQIDTTIKDRHLDFYSKVMEVDSVLSTDTLDALGKDYANYVKKSMAQKHRKELDDIFMNNDCGNDFSNDL